MAKGRIVKALSGFYYVHNEEGLFQCRARGVFRKDNRKPLVGDFVTFEADNSKEGYIFDIDTRRNEMARPPIANVDQALLVFSALKPSFSPLLLNRFLVHAEAHHITPAICISKVDLLPEKEKEIILKYKQDYETIGYEVILTSIQTKAGLDTIASLLNGKVSVIAGQSGVGKSSLLNAIKPNLNIETNEISTHLGRGKHTTRHVELIPFGTGLVADTPGFSSLDFTNIEAIQLADCFPEIVEKAQGCKFRGCTHTKEPKCAIRRAVELKEILAYRYEHYVQFFEEIESQKRRY